MRKCEQNLLSRKRLKAFESGTLSKPAYGFGISVGCLYTEVYGTYTQECRQPYTHTCMRSPHGGTGCIPR